MGIGADVEIQIEIAGYAVVAARLGALAGDAQAAAVLHAGRNRDVDGVAAARTDGPFRPQRRLGEGDGKLADHVGATALAGTGPPPLHGPAAAARVAEQAGEDVAHVEVAAELDPARGGARAAEGAREGVGIEPFGHPVRANRRAFEAVVLLAL